MSDTELCAICSDQVEDGCENVCSKCDCYFCDQHISIVEDGKVCYECADACGNCGDLFFQSHLIECLHCGTRVCPKGYAVQCCRRRVPCDSVTCRVRLFEKVPRGCCNRIVCDNHPRSDAKCHVCGCLPCVNHTFQCWDYSDVRCTGEVRRARNAEHWTCASCLKKCSRCRGNYCPTCPSPHISPAFCANQRCQECRATRLMCISHFESSCPMCYIDHGGLGCCVNCDLSIPDILESSDVLTLGADIGDIILGFCGLNLARKLEHVAGEHKPIPYMLRTRGLSSMQIQEVSRLIVSHFNAGTYLQRQKGLSLPEVERFINQVRRAKTKSLRPDSQIKRICV